MWPQDRALRSRLASKFTARHRLPDHGRRWRRPIGWHAVGELDVTWATHVPGSSYSAPQSAQTVNFSEYRSSTTAFPEEPGIHDA